jgi:ABC-type bacteriocin/lantibiotic exporter with double-glycine peptidase domain
VLAIWLVWLGQKRAFRQGEAAEGATSVFVHAMTNGMRKIRLAGAEDRAFVKWAERFSRSRLKLINVRRVTNSYLAFSAGFDVAALAAVLAVLAILREDDLPVATLFGFVVAFATVMGSLASMGRAVTGVAFQFASIPYCLPVLDAVPPREARKASPGRLSGAVELANVHFRYGEGEALLQGISLKIEPGSFVALVGATGCGKSTLLKLLLGLEKPQGGSVLFDDKELEGMDVEAVRRQIGTVLQRPALMPGTLFDNIRGASNATEEEVWDAAQAAGIADDIRAMPMQLQTLVAEGASSFSGGQVQRIAIARAIVRRPALLLLDEATSALDNSLQAKVSDNLAKLACTRIVVAHRLSTIARADRIVVLDKGQIVEEGSYEELVTAGGHFAAFAQRQSLAA